MKRATISLAAETDFSKAIQSLVESETTHLSGSVALLPSSLDAHDPFVTYVAAALPAQTAPVVVTPVSGAAARRAFMTPTVLGSWIDRNVMSAHPTVTSVTFPNEVALANHRVVVVDVVEVARQGPFVLDLPARYLHPRQRMRLLASGQREAHSAEVASALPIDLHVICLAQREGCVVATTTDVIAAELTALAMSELCHGTPRAFAGPWEDSVVQRATELHLGVLLPSQINIVPGGSEQGSHWARRVLDHLHLRLGVAYSG